MLKNETLLNAFSELDEGYVRSAAAFLGYEEEPMKRKPIKTIFRTVLIAAVIATLMIGTAYAAGLFDMQIRTPEEGEELVGHYTYYDPALQENVTEESDLSNATLILQLDGAGENHKVRFRPGWLPEEQEGYTYERYCDVGVEDQFYYYTCFFDRHQGGCGVLYQVECHYARPGTIVYMDGESAQVVKEEDWGDRHITEIEQVSRYIAADGSPVVFRYVLVFDPLEGWFVSIAGTADFEILEHIAREMEFTTLDEPAEPSGGNYSDYAFLGVGVG